MVDMKGKRVLDRLPQIGAEDGGAVLGQLCLGFKGNQQFESAVMISGVGHATTLNDRSAIAIFDRVWVVCGNTIFCLDLPDLTEVRRHGYADMACLGITVFDEDLLFVYSEAISRIGKEGTEIWTVELPDRIHGFPVIGEYFIKCHLDGGGIISLEPVSGGIVERQDGQ